MGQRSRAWRLVRAPWERQGGRAGIAVIGAGITGVRLGRWSGFEVTVFDRHRMSAMETSFANGGQLSASNAETWNSVATIFKGIKWMLQKDAPLLVNPWPSWCARLVRVRLRARKRLANTNLVNHWPSC